MMGKEPGVGKLSLMLAVTVVPEPVTVAVPMRVAPLKKSTVPVGVMVPVVVMWRVKVVVWLTSEGLTELVSEKVAGSMT